MNRRSYWAVNLCIAIAMLLVVYSLAVCTWVIIQDGKQTNAVESPTGE